ncbi:MAG: glutamate--tRNA ligase, partial [Bacteroidota bacterium]
HEPYRQSERKEQGIYKKYAEQMIESGHAYYAFDTAEELDAMRARLTAAKVTAPQYNAITRQSMRNSLTLPEDEVKRRLENNEPYVIRLKVPRNEEIRLHDIIRGWVVVHSSQVDDKVLLKSDGMPTYHLAHIVDDILMEITHAVRGEEWLPSAPAHLLIYRYLGWEDKMPQYAHLPLLLKPDGNGKLSKRDGDKLGFPVFPLEWIDPVTGEKSSGYREMGYFPEAVINIIALLGWNPGHNTEIMSMEELIAQFSFEKVSKSGAKFDPEKAKWFNQQYLRHTDDKILAAEFMKDLANRGLDPNAEYVEQVCRLIKEKAHFIKEFWDLGSFFFNAPDNYDEDVIKKKWNDNARKAIEKGKDDLRNATVWKTHDIELTFKQSCESVIVNPGSVMQILRVCLSGQAGGPVLWEMAELLGKDEVVSRLETALEKIK